MMSQTQSQARCWRRVDSHGNVEGAAKRHVVKPRTVTCRGVVVFRDLHASEAVVAVAVGTATIRPPEEATRRISTPPWLVELECLGVDGGKRGSSPAA